MTLGDFVAGSMIDFKFTTVQPSTGAPFDLAGTPALSVYKDNSTTQSTTGITLTAPFDTVTGLNHCRIDTSADGTFYSADSHFDVVITTGTVDSVSAVGFVVGRFTLAKVSALRPTTAGRTLDVSAGGEAGVDWANIGSPTTTVNLSGTTVKTATDVETDTADIQTRLPAALVSGRIDSSVGAMAANVLTATAINADAITAAKLAADVTTELQSGLATAAALATVDTVVDAILVDTDTTIPATLATIASYIDTEVAAVKTVTDRLDTAMEIDGAVYRFTVNALELAPSGGGGGLDAAGVRAAIGLASANLDTQLGAIDTVVDAVLVDTGTDIPATLATVAGYLDTEIAAIKAKTDNLPASPAAVSDIPTAAAISDAVWDEAISGHLTGGTTGAALNGAGSAGDPWTTSLPGAYSAGTAGYIVGTNLNATVSSRLASASYTAPLDASGVRSAVGLASANLDTQLTAIDDYLDTELAAIKAKTDNLPPDPADQSAVEAAILAAWTTAITESYASNGAAFTPAQGMYAIHQMLMDFAISGTTISVKQLGGTEAFAVTLDDATTPTSASRD